MDYRGDGLFLEPLSPQPGSFPTPRSLCLSACLSVSLPLSLTNFSCRTHFTCRSASFRLPSRTLPPAKSSSAAACFAPSSSVHRSKYASPVTPPQSTHRQRACAPPPCGLTPSCTPASCTAPPAVPPLPAVDNGGSTLPLPQHALLGQTHAPETISSLSRLSP